MKGIHDTFRIIKPSPYEKNDQYHKEIWENFFEDVEKTVQEKIIDENEVTSALRNKKVKELIDGLEELQTEQKKLFKTEKEHDSNDEDYINQENWDMKVHVEGKMITAENHRTYSRFLHLPEERVAVWRPEEACSTDKINEMSLSQRGEIVTNVIAKDFCDWLRNLGGLEKTAMDEDILKELFQIGLENPAAKSICVQMRERPVVSMHLAEAVNLPRKAFTAGLQRQILWDIDAEKTKQKRQAFNSQLPSSYQWRPPNNQTSKTWLDCGTVPENLVTFSKVFEGITQLRSVTEYCSWLLKNPQFRQPDYLANQGLFKPLKNMVYTD